MKWHGLLLSGNSFEFTPSSKGHKTLKNTNALIHKDQSIVTADLIIVHGTKDVK